MNPFLDIVGNAPVVNLLRTEIASPAHAYLFVGPSQVGKATIARRFAGALLGAGDEGVRRALGPGHPDLTVVEPSGRTSITVDQVRSVVSLASLAPLESDRKVFLFEEGSMMNDEAANALLKTLEEPTPTTVFVIVVDAEEDLPSTIASRCRTVVFGRVTDADVEAGLIAMGVDVAQAARVAGIAGGRPGMAIALATQPEVSGFRQAWLDIPGKVSEHPGVGFRLAELVIDATEPLLKTIKDRHMSDREDTDPGSKATKDRRERELKRAATTLHISGLEMLAGVYRDIAAAQLGASVHNSDLTPTALMRVSPRIAMRNAERVLDTISHLRANQRPGTAFANLFCSLGAP